jgi:acetyl esterase/lipase
MGSGEGSAVAVRVNELQRTMHESDFRGSVAIHRLADLDAELLAANAPSRVALFLVHGMQTAFPQFVPSEILRAAALPQYQQIERDCTDWISRSPSAAEMLKPEWRQNRQLENFFARNRLALTQAVAPVMVIASENDPLIGATAEVVSRLCERGDQVQFEKYPESDPARVIGDSARDQLAWIQSRFAGRPASSNCHFKLRR